MFIAVVHEPFASVSAPATFSWSVDSVLYGEAIILLV